MEKEVVLQNNKAVSAEKLSQLKKAVTEIAGIGRLEDFCIYATGSYARGEASVFSDIDLFFITSGKEKEDALSKLEKILIDAELIKITRDLKFPDFSNDGQFLKVHYLDDIKDNLGTPDDDFNNFFTARMLLILESIPIFNEEFYNKSINQILDTYLRDYGRHNEDFKPMFLLNDVVRFWKTLCLNYEAKRNKFTDQTSEKEIWKSSLMNYKLYFSRKLTCYSFVIRMAAIEGVLNKADLLNICNETPIERLKNIALEKPDLNEQIDKITKLYEEFLVNTAHEKGKLIEWVKIDENKDRAQLKGKEFGNCLFELLLKVCETKPEILQYLVI